MAAKKDLEGLRSQFLKKYASIPLNLRDEIVAVIENEPVSWAAAFVEIQGKTKKGDQILELMDGLKLLGD
jgi:hypothetical protein